jgi:translation initiation factor 1
VTDRRNSRPVYSTQSGRLCPGCSKPVVACACRKKRPATANTGGAITLWRESKGRAGREVTVIRNLPLDDAGLKQLASRLKSRCGSGGTVSGTEIEIQGDRRTLIKALLEAEGYQVKLAGG